MGMIHEPVKRKPRFRFGEENHARCPFGSLVNPNRMSRFSNAADVEAEQARDRYWELRYWSEATRSIYLGYSHSEWSSYSLTSSFLYLTSNSLD